MKKFLALLSLCLPLAVGAQTSIQFQLSVGNLNISPFTNVQVILQQVGINSSSTMTYLGEPIYQYTDTNATTTFSNLQTAAGGATSYWAWTIPANSTPNGPVNSYSGYVQVTSTNLGTISSSLVQVFAVPTPTGLGWAYSAQTSDLRYSPSTAVLTNYALLGNLNSASNFLQTEIVGSTNGQTAIVFSNPNAFSTPVQVTNIVLSLAQTNTPTSLVTITNIANAAANAVGLNGTNYATGATNIAVANLTAAIIGTNNALVAALSATNTALIADLNAASNSLKTLAQPASGVLTNLSGTGALTNALAAGQNFSITTNGSGTIITLNATNQTFLTNGLAVWNNQQPSSFLGTNMLPGLTNGFVSAGVTNGLATLQAATNAALGVYSNNPAGYVTAGITNGFATTNWAYPASNPSNFISAAATNSLATTNYVQAYADTNGAARAAIGVLLYQQASQTLTNLAGTGAFTNIPAAGQNFALTTNGSGTVVYFNATNQTWLTNHMLDTYANTNTLNGWYDTNGAGAVAAAAATNGILNRYAPTNILNGWYDTNGAGQSAVVKSLTTATNSFDPTNSAATVQAQLLAVVVTNNTPYLTLGGVGLDGGTLNASSVYSSGTVQGSSFIGSGASLTSIPSNAIVSINPGQISPAIVIPAIPTTNTFQVTTSGLAQVSFGLGTKTNWLITTNIINIIGGGLPVSGDYLGAPLANLWTNLDNPAETIQYAAPTFFLYTNYSATLLYQSSGITNWSVAGKGVIPGPVGAWGSKWRIGGIVDGYLNSTDLTAQIARYLATNSGATVGTNSFTNFIMGGVITNLTTNTMFSTAGSNVILNLIAANGVNPTNGVTSATVTNIVTGMTNGLATLSAMTNYVTAITNIVTTEYQVQIATATNGFTTAAVTNGLATTNWVQGLTNTASGFTTLGLLTNYVAANSGGGGSGWANTNLSNISQTATNAILAMIGGTNGITLSQATNVVTGMTNGLATISFVDKTFTTNINGQATNITLTSSKLIGVTNLNVFGITTLNSSNIQISYLVGGALIPQMTSTTAPSGQIIGGVPFTVPSSNFYAFQTNQSSGTYWAPTAITPSIEYDFGYNVVVQSLAGQFQAGIGGTGPYSCLISNSVDGVNWNNVITLVNPTADAVQTVSTSLVSSVSARYWLWTFPKPGGGAQDSVISALQLYVPSVNIIASSNLLSIVSTNGGVGINTNYAGTNALEVNGSVEISGNVDSTVGYTVNGVPVGSSAPNGLFINQQNGLGTNASLFGTNFISGTYFFGSNSTPVSYSGLVASGAPTAYSYINGLYLSATNNNAYYTNTTSGWMLINALAVFPVEYPVYYLATNFNSSTLLGIGTFPIYYSAGTVVGSYIGYNNGGLFPTGSVLVAYANSVYTNLTNIGVSVNTNSAGTNTLEVNGWVDSTKGFSVNGSVIPPAIIIATNDNTIATFIATNNITDKSAQDDLYLAAQDCKAFGFWTNLVDAWPLESRFNSTNLFSLRSVPFTFSNALFNPKGATFWGTNHIEQVMPQLTNFTICLMWSQPASNLDAYDQSSDYGMLAEMINTNDQSSVLLHQWTIYRGVRAYTSSGTNYYGTNNPYGQTNQISMVESGETRNDDSMAPITEQFLCLSYSNGWLQASMNGNFALFNQAGFLTNTINEMTNLSYITTFRIGGQDTNWNRFLVNGTNAFGVTVMNAMVFNVPLSTNLAICAYRMATDLEPYAKATELAGSSILNNQRSASGGSVGTPLTNCLAYQDMLLNPDRLVIQSASPGSELLNWTNCVYGTTPSGYPYTPSLLYLNPKKYTTRSFKTDAFRNDQANGADTLVGSYQKMLVYFTNLYANRIDLDLIVTPWTYAVAASDNLNFIEACFYFKTNFPLTHFYNFAALVSSNRLAAASQDNPPTHPDAINPSGLLMNVAMDDVINGKPTVYDQPPDSIASGGLVRDASITSMSQLGFVVKAQDGSTRLTYDLSAGTNLSGTNVTQTVSAQTVSNLLIKSYALAGPPTTPSTINFAGGSYLTEPEAGVNQTLTVLGNSGLVLSGNSHGVSFVDAITGLGTGLTNASGQAYGTGVGNVVSNNPTFLPAVYNPGGTNSYVLIQSNQVQIAGNGNVMQFSNAAIIQPDMPAASGLQPGYGILEQGGGVGAAQIGFNAHNVVVNSNAVIEGNATFNGPVNSTATNYWGNTNNCAAPIVSTYVGDFQNMNSIVLPNYGSIGCSGTPFFGMQLIGAGYILLNGAGDGGVAIGKAASSCSFLLWSNNTYFGKQFSGYVDMDVSNYDLYYSTPTTTNMMVAGQASSVLTITSNSAAGGVAETINGNVTVNGTVTGNAAGLTNVIPSSFPLVSANAFAASTPFGVNDLAFKVSTANQPYFILDVHALTNYVAQSGLTNLTANLILCSSNGFTSGQTLEFLAAPVTNGPTAQVYNSFNVTTNLSANFNGNYLTNTPITIQLPITKNSWTNLSRLTCCFLFNGIAAGTNAWITGFITIQ